MGTHQNGCASNLFYFRQISERSSSLLADLKRPRQRRTCGDAFQFVTEGVCHEGKPLRINRQVTRQVFGRKQFQKFQRASGAKAMRKRKGKFMEAAKSDEIEGGKAACEQGQRLRNGR